MTILPLFLVKFGEMELSNFTYWSLIAVGISFLVSFLLSSIPLANNIKKSKTKDS